MNLEISKYLNKYIQEKYPRYYKAISKKDFMTFVNAIASNPMFNKFSVEEISSGSKDVIIDELIDKYAQLKITDVWESILFEYLSDYVQREFVIYYKALGEQEFKSFVNVIAANSVFYVHGLNAVLRAELDTVIDKLVNEYAQKKLTKVWANFGSLCNHIKTIIVEYPDSEAKCINEKTLDDIVKKIAEGFIKDHEDYIYYMDGLYDKVFLLGFDSHCDKIKKDCNDHIRKIIENSNLNIVYDKLTYDALLEQVMNAVLLKYDINDIMNGKRDEEIFIMFKSCCEELKRNVQSYVRLQVNSIEHLSGIPVETVVSEITEMAINTGELSAFNILNGNLNQLIEGHADKRRKKLVNRIDALNHVHNVAIMNNTLSLSIEELNDIINKIFNELYNVRNYKLNDIVDGKYDDMIISWIEAESRRYASVKSMKDKRTEKIKHKPRKRRTTRTVMTLLVAGTITAASVIGTSALVNLASNSIEEQQYNKAVRTFEDHDVINSSLIHTIHSDEFNEAVDDVMDFYSLCKKNGLDDSKYFSLGFKLVRDHVGGNRRLAVMDNLLRQVKFRANNLDNARDLREVVDDSCFLEFALEELGSMGCEEASDDKYFNLICAYREAAAKAVVEDNKVPWDYLDDNDKDLAFELLDLYEEYTKPYIIEASEILGDVIKTDDEQVVLLSIPKKNGGR